MTPPYQPAIPRENTGLEHWEWQYLELMRRTWAEGDERANTTGLGADVVHSLPQAITRPQTDTPLRLHMIKRTFLAPKRRENPFRWLADWMPEQLEFLFSKSRDAAHGERAYLRLMRKVWEQGDKRVDRTKVGTRSIFGTSLRINLNEDQVPLLTTKKVNWKAATLEMLWFLSGETNIRPLVLQGVNIWNDWPHARYVRETGISLSLRDFVERIASDVKFADEWGNLGPIYGKQWVSWPTYRGVGAGLFRRGPDINQIAQVVESLKTNPGSRRHIIEGWNVAELDKMALPPCHKSYQFHVAGERLNCLMYQRSCDVALGLPFNLFGAALLTRLVAHQTGLYPGTLVWMGGDTHLYLNHANLVDEQLRREPTGEPKLIILRKPDSIFGYQLEDFEVRDYAPQAAIRAPVAV